MTKEGFSVFEDTLLDAWHLQGVGAPNFFTLSQVLDDEPCGAGTGVFE